MLAKGGPGGVDRKPAPRITRSSTEQIGHALKTSPLEPPRKVLPMQRAWCVVPFMTALLVLGLARGQEPRPADPKQAENDLPPVLVESDAPPDQLLQEALKVIKRIDD